MFLILYLKSEYSRILNRIISDRENTHHLQSICTVKADCFGSVRQELSTVMTGIRKKYCLVIPVT